MTRLKGSRVAPGSPSPRCASGTTTPRPAARARRAAIADVAAIRGRASSSARCWPARSAGWSIAYLGALVHPAAQRVLGRRTRSRGRVEPFPGRSTRSTSSPRPRSTGRSPSGPSAWPSLVTRDRRRCSRSRSPTTWPGSRRRGSAAILVIAVLMPLWAAYLVKVYAWRTILQGNGFLEWVLEPVRDRRARARRDRQLLARAELPLAAVHDPADLRRARADPAVAARGVVGPRRPAADDVPAGRPAARRSRRSSPARSSRSR